MATKIRIDFSKVEERSAWNTKQMPEGLYSATIAECKQTQAQDGTDMLVYALVPTENKYRNRRFPYYCKIQPNQLWKLRDLLVAGGMSVPKKAQQIDPEKVVGARVAISVEDDTYNGVVRSAIGGVYPADILDDVDSSEFADPEDDFEDDDFEDEGLDDDFEDDDFEEVDLDDIEEVDEAPVKKPAKAGKR